jgi:flagellar biosynthesis/type III secretory pathway chaperone
MTDTARALQIFSQVESVLSAEKHLLLSGQVHRVVELAEEKVQAMAAFDSLLQEAAHMLRAESLQSRLKGIIQAASENSAHFRAVQNGLQSIVTRLGRVSQDSYVGAYQSNGLQTPFTKATGNYLKKA